MSARFLADLSMHEVSRMNIYNWDLLSDESIYYYVLGLGNFVFYHKGWDWSFKDFTDDRVWMEEEE